MSLLPPTISGVSPSVNDTDVVLRPTITMVVGGQSLVDPLTWGAGTFALYGPGKVVLEIGPGSILNSGLDDAPFPILGGPLRRDIVDGTYTISISGANGQVSGMGDAESFIGSSKFILCEFAPSIPLLPNTEYTAVLVGDDSSDLFYGGPRRYEGLTSYTSPSGFVQSGVSPGITSGFIQVVHPYSKIIQTSEYNSTTGQNDTYTITITSGTSSLGFKYNWSQASTPGTNSSIVSGTTDRHNLGNGLQIDFEGTFALGEVHQLNTYIPKPLATSHVWKFSTGEITSFTTPPVEPDNISVVIDETAEGGFGVDTTTALSGSLFQVIDSEPSHLEYDVATDTAFIRLQFNQPLSSGVYAVGNVEVTSTPLLGLPTPAAASTITPTRLETSGAFLKIYLE